ncbi:MAG: iron-sulfur cluster repair di-iron protein [Gemmatimonadota bacterium]
MFTAQSTLGELVADRPDAARTLHRHGLDFCCGGRQSIESACRARGLDPEALLDEIDRQTPPAVEAKNWKEATLDELIQHILERYHEPLKGELPRLADLAGKVERAHADKADSPRGLSDLLREVVISVDSHLAKEERILFPAIRAGRGAMARGPVQAMMLEHEDHGKNLLRIREITGNLALPSYACSSWTELYRALAELERDLMDHIHLENNILFPRALVE